MRNIVLLAVLTFFFFALHGQQALQELIDVEKNFANLSREKNTRDAFVANLADSGIVFVKGNPVLGKSLWEKRTPGPGRLFWWPLVSDISASGDFGYNTGPYEFSKTRTERPEAFGYFSSVWKKNDQGIWKVMIDIGASIPAQEKEAALPQEIKPIMKKVANGGITIEKFEQGYIEKLNRDGLSFLPEYFSKDGRLHHTGSFPVITYKNISQHTDTRKNYKFEWIGGETSRAGDMAYVYGKVTAVEKANEKPVTLNYMRILKKEDGKNWVIVLDVIGG